ncbi:MAG TPA: branched-chain amino acid ABC transporter permease [Pyrinomonadaceae bacterium]|nr:branched-chain amino acid ABC transporter permease [Pyrinomonadaceae bacterium]
MILWQLLANGLVNGCLYAMMALGFALIYNTSRIFHIAYGATFTTAAYLCVFFLTELQLGLPLSVAMALLLSALLGVLIEVVVYSPLRRKNASLLIALLSSLGLYIIIVNLITVLFGNETRVMQSTFGATYEFGGIILTRVQVAQVICAAVLIPALLLSLRLSSLGMVIRALRDNETLTRLMGENINFVRCVMFAVGSVLAGIGAILSGLDVGVTPHIGMPAVLIAAVALIVGGVGTFHGAVVGAFLLGTIQSLIVWQISAKWTDAITFAVLILFLLFRPQGLLGTKRRLEEGAV